MRRFLNLRIQELLLDGYYAHLYPSASIYSVPGTGLKPEYNEQVLVPFAVNFTGLWREPALFTEAIS